MNTEIVPVLSVERLVKDYGAIRVTDGVSLAIGPGERHALIGPNGAGKSTLFNLIAGSIRPTSGTVRLGGHNVTGVSERGRSVRGISRTFQHSSLFGSLDAVANIEMALRRRHGLHRSPFPRPRRQRELAEQAHDLLDRVGLALTDAPVASLAHGHRRQLEVAMALATRPKVLLFDEPTAGMSSAETETFTDLVTNISRDVAIMLIEHDLDVVFSLADTVTVLAAGAVIASGDPDTIRESREVQEAYLGTDLEEVFA